MTLAQLKKQFHYNAVMKDVVLHLRHLSHGKVIFIYDQVDILLCATEGIHYENFYRSYYFIHVIYGFSVCSVQ